MGCCIDPASGNDDDMARLAAASGNPPGSSPAVETAPASSEQPAASEAAAAMGRSIGGGPDAARCPAAAPGTKARSSARVTRDLVTRRCSTGPNERKPVIGRITSLEEALRNFEARRGGCIIRPEERETNSSGYKLMKEISCMCQGWPK
ncbi:hypothetical protein EJB05_35284, partial [Eragrostis curvula]